MMIRLTVALVWFGALFLPAASNAAYVYVEKFLDHAQGTFLYIRETDLTTPLEPFTRSFSLRSTHANRGVDFVLSLTDDPDNFSWTGTVYDTIRGVENATETPHDILWSRPISRTVVGPIVQHTPLNRVKIWQQWSFKIHPLWVVQGEVHSYRLDIQRFTYNTMPEPSAVILGGSGLLALIARRLLRLR